MENTKIYKKRIASIVIAAGIALSGTGGYFGISNAIYDSKSKTKIENLSKEKFGDIAGLAQQYLFYWRREQS